jgi:hypothetical protein
MDLDDILSSTGLPEVSVDADAALTRTVRRGQAWRRRRTGFVAITVAVVIAASATTALSLANRDDHTRVATNPGPEGQQGAASSTTAPLLNPEPGTTAVWTTDPHAPPSSTASTFTALVFRLECNDGVTGRVLRPGVAFDETQVVVTFTVARKANPAEASTCQGNGAVPVQVDLGQQLGTRDLVDGSCAPGNEALSTSWCVYDHGVRWRH